MVLPTINKSALLGDSQASGGGGKSTTTAPATPAALNWSGGIQFGQNKNPIWLVVVGILATFAFVVWAVFRKQPRRR